MKRLLNQLASLHFSFPSIGQIVPAQYKIVSRLAMFKLLPIFLILILGGCAPHFYEAKALKVNAEGLTVIASGELNDNCIASSEIPLMYELRRELYTIEFSVSRSSLV